MDLLTYRANDDNIGLVIPDPHIAQIEEIRQLIIRDTGSTGDVGGTRKLRAKKELSYIYFMVNHQSPFIYYDIETRKSKIKEQLFDDDWEPDEIVIKAMLKYRELYETPLIRLLKSSLEAVEKLRSYFTEIDFSARGSRGALVYNPKDVIAALGKLGSVVSSLEELKIKVEKEIADTNTRGEVRLNKYNQ